MDRIYELLAEARRDDARYDLVDRRAQWGDLREGTRFATHGYHRA